MPNANKLVRILEFPFWMYAVGIIAAALAVLDLIDFFFDFEDNARKGYVR